MPASRALALLTACLLAAGVASGQAAYRFDHVGTEDGLSQSSVTALAQDSQGYLWIGTDDGLNRYDGLSVVVYRHILEDPTTVPSSRITSLLVTDGGDLWVGTMGGLARFDRQTETFRTPAGAPGDPASPCSADVTALSTDAAGAMWAGTFSGGLCHLTRAPAADSKVARRAPQAEWSATRVEVEAPDGTSIERIYALLTDVGGTPWALLAPGREAENRACRTTPAGACVFDDPATLVRTVSPSSRTVLVDTTPSMGLGTRSADGSVERVRRPTLPAGVEIAHSQEVVAVEGGDLWVGTTDSGLLVVDPETGRVDTVLPDPEGPRSISSPSVQSLLVDQQGSVWVGTARGLDRWAPPDAAAFQVYGRGPRGGLSDERVTGLLEARDGTLWVGTRDGINRLRPGSRRVDVLRQQDRGPNANAFWYLAEGRDGTIWAGSKQEGLFRIAPGSDRVESVDVFADLDRPPEGPSGMQVRHVLEDREGRIWVALDQGLAIRTADGQWHTTLAGDGFPLPSARTNITYQDRRGRIWVGTDAGLCILAHDASVPDDLRFGCYQNDPASQATLGADIVWAVAEDADGHLWAGTVGGGLATFDYQRGTFERLTTRDGLPNNTVYGLVADRDGALWATTNAGLAHIEPTTRRVTVFTTADGLPSDEFDFMAYDAGPSGTVYAGGPSGFVSFDTDRVFDGRASMPVVVTGAQVFGEPYPGLFADGDTLRLQYDQNFFQLRFSSLDLRSPRRARYRYRLDNYEDEWRTTDADTPEAGYTAVPPGEYTFLVRSDGIRPIAATRLHVIVVPAMWQTAWFQVGIALALLLVAGGVTLVVQRQRAVVRSQREADVAELKRRVAEGRDRERVRLARELHDGPVQDLYSLGHELDRIRLRESTGDTQSLSEARERVTTVTSNLRDVLATLRPPVIPHLGLAAALEALARRRRHRQLAITLDLDREAAAELPSEVQNAIYRIVQESLANVVKHAEATSVRVALRRQLRGVEVTVEDDGVGFEPPTQLLDLARAGRFGVVGASERAEVLDGTLRVESAPGQGTTVRAWLPLSVA
ncbi:MAG: two-component regulator propeller domain-containing protein [Bacteroidota bacterium]